MTPLPDPRLLEQAVVRGHYRCSLCGRPCSDHDARRHSEPGSFGDSALNFAAMCKGCMAWLEDKAPLPARYIAHIHDVSRTARIVRKIACQGAIAITLATFMSFAGMAGWIVYHTPPTVWGAVGTGCLLAMLLAAGGGIVSGLLGRTDRPAQIIHHTFDEQRVRVEGGR